MRLEECFLCCNDWLVKGQADCRLICETEKDMEKKGHGTGFMDIAF